MQSKATVAPLSKGEASDTYQLSLQGSKNNAFPVLALACMSDRPVVVQNVPEVGDVKKFIICLKHIGVNVRVCGDTSYEIDGAGPISNSCEISVAADIRASLYLIPVMLSCSETCRMVMPGGCDLGSRGIDVHVQTLAEFGFLVSQEGQSLIVERCEGTSDAFVKFRYPSHMGSNIASLMAIARQVSTNISGLAPQPEVLYLIKLMQSGGIDINLNGDQLSIITTAKSRLHAIQVMPDRIAAFSEICLALANRVGVTVPCNVGSLLKPEIDILSKLSLVEVAEESQDFIKLSLAATNTSEVQEFETGPFPLLTTDNQPALVALCCVLGRPIRVIERMFTSRFLYALELEKLGALVEVRVSKSKTINQKPAEMLEVLPGEQEEVADLTKIPVLHAHDLRGGFACLIYVTARGLRCHLLNCEQVARGYSSIANIMSKVGYSYSVS